MPSVLVCVPSRNSRTDDEPMGSVLVACEHARRQGYTVEGPGKAKNAYAVVTSRNIGVASLLEGNHDHLLMVDDDTLLPPHAISSLMDAAARGPGVYSGCVPAVRIKGGEMKPYVTVKPRGTDWLTVWPRGNIECEAVGAACLLVSRPVVVALGFPWFRWIEKYERGIGVKATGEDVDFCARVLAAGFKITALSSVRCGHLKEVNIAALIP